MKLHNFFGSEKADAFEKEQKMEPYVFCDENLSAYEKTIYILAIAYGIEPSFRWDEAQINEFSSSLEVRFDLLSSALEKEALFPYGEIAIKFGDQLVNCGDFFKRDFFDVITKLLLIYKKFDEIFDGTEKDEVIENIRTFDVITFLFDSVNSTVATYECMYKNVFSYDNTMYDSAEHFSPKDYIEMLKLLVMSEHCCTYDKAWLQIITKLLKYELKTRINALYLVTTCQILKHSPCFDEDTKSIASELYGKLLHILKNGKVISININSLFRKIDKPVVERCKKDNTSRMQILYGYSNYDCYDLRLDFSHKGQEFVHFNNETPGGLSCCIFTDDEYQEVIKECPGMEKCFVSYSGRWALKEKNNCEFSGELADIYDNIRKKRAHDSVFNNEYSEETISFFIETMAKMLRKECRRAIDTDGTYARYCFNYDAIMKDVTMLYWLRNTGESLFWKNSIADKAYRYGLIPERRKIDTLEQVLEIIEMAERRI